MTSGRTLIYGSGTLLLYAATAAVFLCAVPPPREPLHYLVAGAFATAVTLLLAFGLYAAGRFTRRRDVGLLVQR